MRSNEARKRVNQTTDMGNIVKSKSSDSLSSTVDSSTPDSSVASKRQG